MKKLISEEEPVEGYIKGWSKHAKPILKPFEPQPKSKVTAYNIFRATRELVRSIKP